MTTRPTRLAIVPAPPAGSAAAPATPTSAPILDGLLLPAADGGADDPALPAPFAALRPDANHNGALLRALESAPQQGRWAAGLLAADPFLRPAETADRLREAGVAAVANMPTTALFGTEFATTLDDVGLGPRREFERLRQFAAEGLTTCCVLCDEAWLRPALAARPSLLILAPDAPLRAAETVPRVRFARLWDALRTAHTADPDPLPPAFALLDAPPDAHAPPRPPAGLSGVVHPLPA